MFYRYEHYMSILHMALIVGIQRYVKQSRVILSQLYVFKRSSLVLIIYAQFYSFK